METDVQLLVAIDYSSSNRHPSEADSLHREHPENPRDLNAYEQAISSVGNILVQYDSDQMIPLYGFAGRVQQKDNVFGTVSHCFKVVEDEVKGVPGLLQAYRDSLKRIRLHQPTMFSLIIDQAGKIARARAEE
jgi:hypothetical protein